MINYSSVSRKLMCVGTLLAVFTSSAFGLGFGKLEVMSGLGEPFSGRISLTSLYTGDNENLGVALASASDFNRAGLGRPEMLSNFQFEIAYDSANEPYIKVTSDSPIGEPLLQFMVALEWQGGRLVRNFSALLDPPTYARNGNSAPALESESTPKPAFADAVSQPAQPIEQSIEPVEAVVSEPDSQQIVIEEPMAAETIKQETVATSGTTADTDADEITSYKVKRGQSLWIVADRTRGDSTTIHQMMMAIFNENPRAFLKGDINMLKAGATLSIPSSELRNVLTRREAIAAFQRATEGEIIETAVAANENKPADIQPAKEPELPAEPEAALAATKPSVEAATSQTQTSIVDDVETDNQTATSEAGTETIELTNANETVSKTINPTIQADESVTTEDTATNKKSLASSQFGQQAGSSESKMSVTDDATLNYLTQEVALLESTLAQANSENQDLKKRIDELEDKVDITSRFLEFQSIALAITDDGSSLSADTDQDSEPAAAPSAAQTNANTETTADSQTVINEGLLAATQALTASDEQPVVPTTPTADTTEEQRTVVADDNGNLWTSFQDTVATRFDGLKSVFASSTSETMQPILAMIAVVILALGALMAIFRHRSFGTVEYAAYPSNRGSIGRSINRKPSRSYNTNVATSAKSNAQDKVITSGLPSTDTSADDATSEKPSVKYAGASTLIEEAEVYMALGKEDKAEETLKNAIKGGSVDTEASMKLMEIYQKREPRIPAPEPTPKVIPDPDIMEALVPSAPIPDPIQIENIKPSSSVSDSSKSKTEVTDSDLDKTEEETTTPSIPIPDSVQIESIKPSAPDLDAIQRDAIKLPPVLTPDFSHADTIEPAAPTTDSIQVETITPSTTVSDTPPTESLRPRVEKPENRSPLDQLSTAPSSSSSGDGIPMFDVGDDGLSPTERSALRAAAMSANVDKKPDDVAAKPEPKTGRRSKLLQASRGTEFETRSKDDQIKDLESKLDTLQNQMDEILRRLSRDDSSNSSGGGAA